MKKFRSFFFAALVCLVFLASFAGCRKEKKLYTLSEAYKNGYISKADVCAIGNSASTNVSTEEKLLSDIKREYVREFSRNGYSWKDVKIHGLYNVCERYAAVGIGYTDQQSEGVTQEFVAGISFLYPYDSEIVVYMIQDIPRQYEKPVMAEKSVPLTQLYAFSDLDLQKVKKINVIYQNKAFTIDDGERINELKDAVASLKARQKIKGEYLKPFVGNIVLFQGDKKYIIDFDVLESDGKEYILETDILQKKIAQFAQNETTSKSVTYNKPYAVTVLLDIPSITDISTVRIRYRGEELYLEKQETNHIITALLSMKAEELRTDAKIFLSSETFAEIEIGTKENFISILLTEKDNVLHLKEGSFLLFDAELKSLISDAAS